MVARLLLVLLLLVAPHAHAHVAGPRPIVARPFHVVVDPGHGGHNGGCTSHDGTVLEKEITLALALELAAALEQRLPQATVTLTRSDDRDLPLAERVAMANAAKADLFMSLHANASPDRSQQGFETYVLDARASTWEAARTARRENDEGLAEPAARGDAPEARTMVRELELVAHRTVAARFAQVVQAAQAKSFPDRPDRGVKQAPFDVLIGARMPAILFEAGFLDHPEEGALLVDADARRRIVDALVEAIVLQYREHLRRAPR